jgi:hypothetical protein
MEVPPGIPGCEAARNGDFSYRLIRIRPLSSFQCHSTVPPLKSFRFFLKRLMMRFRYFGLQGCLPKKASTSSGVLHPEAQKLKTSMHDASWLKRIKIHVSILFEGWRNGHGERRLKLAPPQTEVCATLQ